MLTKQKNKRTRLIALLALFVTVTSIFIGTLAKYVTKETISDSAVVATFGLNIPNEINLDSYTNVTADAEGKKIIAPGTTGHYDFTITGTSEVAYKVLADITLTYSDEWEDYEPLKFSFDGENWLDLATFKTTLSGLLESEELEPNETYTTEQAIHWEWPFHTSEENDIKDTALGVMSADSEQGTPSVTLSIKATAEQID